MGRAEWSAKGSSNRLAIIGTVSITSGTLKVPAEWGVPRR